MRKRKEGGSKKGAPAWMNTYGDMVTLLLTFFVLLYSFSSVDAEKWQNLVVSLGGGDKGVLQNNAPVETSNVNQEEYEALKSKLADFQSLYESIKGYIAENDLETKITLTKTDNEIQIRFVDNVLFDSGSADLKNDAIEILSKITLALKTYSTSIEMIRIEGHTDNVAINTAKFPTNWELSTARAVGVLRNLIEKEQLDANVVSAVGYGEYHSIADNSTPEGRAKNRRVDFVIARTAE